MGSIELAWIQAAEAAPSGEEAAPAAIPAGLDPEAFEAEPGGEAATGLEGSEDGGNPSDALREGLFGRPLPVPTVAEPDLEREPELHLAKEEVAGSGEEDDLPIDATATATDMLSMAEGDDLDLDRLSAVRPELALMTPSTWLLIRNPTEVDDFMKRSYRTGDLDPEAAGLVGVTLWIDESGSVEWAEVSRSSGQSEMDEVALALFSEVVAFRPARERGVSISTSAIFWVTFPW